MTYSVLYDDKAQMTPIRHLINTDFFGMALLSSQSMFEVWVRLIDIMVVYGSGNWFLFDMVDGFGELG